MAWSCPTMRRRSAVSNSPASLLRRFGSSTVARFVLIIFKVFPIVILIVRDSPRLSDKICQSFVAGNQSRRTRVSARLPWNKQASGHGPEDGREGEIPVICLNLRAAANIRTACAENPRDGNGNSLRMVEPAMPRLENLSSDETYPRQRKVFVRCLTIDSLTTVSKTDCQRANKGGDDRK